MGEEADNPTTPDLVEVYTTQGHLRANVIKSKLEAAGIPALLSYDSASLVFGLTVDGIGEVRVMVSEQYAAEARRIVAEEQPLEVLLDYGDMQIRALCRQRGVDWDGLSEEERERLIDDLLHQE